MRTALDFQPDRLDLSIHRIRVSLDCIGLFFNLLMTSSNRPATSYNLTSISTAELESNDSSAGVGWNLGSSSKPKDTVVTEIFGIPLRHSSAPLRLAIDGASRNFSVQPTEGQCINIQVSCSDQPCGTRPLFRNAVVPSRAEGQWPWHASIFVNGSYLCGATLVSRRWLVASDLCASRVEYG